MCVCCRHARLIGSFILLKYKLVGATLELKELHEDMLQENVDLDSFFFLAPGFCFSSV